MLGSRPDSRVDRGAMADEVGVRGDKLLERRIDRVEINIGDEAVDAGVDAGRLGSMQVAVRGHEVRQNPQIREPARVGGRRSKAADTLVMIALRIEFLRLVQALLVKLGCSPRSASRKAGQNCASFQRE
jgi:hypothetical protein